MCKMAGLAGEHVVKPDLNCNWAAHDSYGRSGIPRSEAVSCEDRMGYFRDRQYTWGQIERELLPSDRCWGSYSYGVMLREPMDLMRSMMNFHPNIGKGFVTSLQKELRSPEAATLDQFALWKIMDNYAVRLLAPALTVPAGQINQTHYEAALETLSHFDHVQRLEDLPDNAEALFKDLSWPETLRQFVSRKENAAAHQHDFTSEEASWLEEVNRFDIALYKRFR